MAVLFHQNMRTFGGAAPLRNAAYNTAVGGAFATIAAGIPGGVGPVAVAGFTEILNNISSVGTLATSCQRLGVGPNVGGQGGNIACGRTALANGPEYIYIGVNAAYPVLTVGQIFLQVVGKGITLLHQRSAGFPALGLPRAATRDYRGVTYVIVSLPAPNPGGLTMAVGFMHNLYTFTDQRALVAGKIPQILQLMGAAASGQPAIVPTHSYIGGDFNVRVTNRRGTGRTGYAYCSSLGMVAPPPGAAAGGTTWSGSLYDYWYSDIVTGVAPALPFVAPVPFTHTQTLNAGPGIAGTMSDHCGVSLQFM